MNFQYPCKMPKKMNKKLNPPCRFLVPTSFSSLRKISRANRMSVEANSAILTKTSAELFPALADTIFLWERKKKKIVLGEPLNLKKLCETDGTW